jgi:hypothetical protein
MLIARSLDRAKRERQRRGVDNGQWRTVGGKNIL